MTNLQQYEEEAAWFSRADRFDGFDRGDLDCDVDELPDGPPDESWDEDIPY
jgi:hypothetical protein